MFVPASFCVSVFTLVGLSILETMLIDFLLALDGYCGNNAQNAVNNQEVEIQLEGKGTFRVLCAIIILFYTTFIINLIQFINSYILDCI